MSETQLGKCRVGFGNWMEVSFKAPHPYPRPCPTLPPHNPHTPLGPSAQNPEAALREISTLRFEETRVLPFEFTQRLWCFNGTLIWLCITMPILIRLIPN